MQEYTIHSSVEKLSYFLKIHRKSEKDIINTFFPSNSNYLTKSEFRKGCLLETFPFTREDCHIIFHELSGKDRKITKSSFIRFISDPHLICQSMDLDNSHLFEIKRDKTIDIWNKTKMKLINSNINLAIIFESEGTKDFLIDYSTFNRILKNSGMNISNQEITEMFDQLKGLYENRIDYREFLEKINNNTISPLTFNSKKVDENEQILIKNLTNQLESQNNELNALKKQLTLKDTENINYSNYEKYNELMNEIEALKRKNNNLEKKCTLMASENNSKALLDLCNKVDELETKMHDRENYIKKLLNGKEYLSSYEENLIKQKYEIKQKELLSIIDSKNNEITIFKKELEEILSELSTLKSRAN